MGGMVTDLQMFCRHIGSLCCCSESWHRCVHCCNQHWIWTVTVVVLDHLHLCYHFWTCKLVCTHLVSVTHCSDNVRKVLDGFLLLVYFQLIKVGTLHAAFLWYSLSNTNQVAWNFLSFEPEVSWYAAAIIIWVVLLTPYLWIRGVSQSSFHYNQSCHIYEWMTSIHLLNLKLKHELQFINFLRLQFINFLRLCVKGWLLLQHSSSP